MISAIPFDQLPLWQKDLPPAQAAPLSLEGRRREKQAKYQPAHQGAAAVTDEGPPVKLNGQGKLFLFFLLAVSVAARADQLVPAGSVIQCTVAEGKISSQTQNIGDPVLCQLSHIEAYGRTSFPYGSYLIGHFAEYKDPGHFVGKGWMELKFDKLIVQPDTVVPIQARVVAVPKYPVDKEGRIHGTGHPVRDTVEWLIPVLWPIDLINLPRRGPRPVLAAESKLTLKVLDDFGIPTPQENAVRTPALVARQTPDEPTYQSYRQPAPIQQSYAPQQQSYANYPPQPGYAPAPQVVYQMPAPVMYQYVAPPPVIVQQPVYAYPPPPPAMYYHPRYYPYGGY